MQSLIWLLIFLAKKEIVIGALLWNELITISKIIMKLSFSFSIRLLTKIYGIIQLMYNFQVIGGSNFITRSRWMVKLKL